jgi:hypothetical protein
MNATSSVSLGAYARHRGCRRQAVSQAIKSGRLRRAVARLEDGTPTIPDFAAADVEWAANTDYTKHPSWIDRAGRTPDFQVGAFRLECLSDLGMIELHYEDPYPPDDDGSTSSCGIGIDAREARRLGELLIAAARQMYP